MAHNYRKKRLQFQNIYLSPEIDFLNEDSLGLIELYMSVSEMEYFPMETNITGYEAKDTFYVEDFEITYIIGCDEQ